MTQAPVHLLPLDERSRREPPPGGSSAVPARVRPFVLPRAARFTRAQPAAVEWEDATLPGVGSLRASAWLPTVLVAACAVALMYLIQTSGVANTSYDIQRLQAEQAAWTLRNEQLRLELAKLRSLTWVEAEAVSRLGMQRPPSVTFLQRPPAGAGP